MTTETRIAALVNLGYTQRKAAFLCLAALHSGYFLRRQFIAFAGITSGKLATTFTTKLLEKRHAKATELRYGQVLFDLCSKPLYTAIGQTDNRNRRTHFVFTIKESWLSISCSTIRATHSLLPRMRRG